MFRGVLVDFERFTTLLHQRNDIDDGIANGEVEHAGHILACLKVKINQQDTLAGFAQCGRKINSHKGFSDASLAAEDRNDSTIHALLLKPLGIFIRDSIIYRGQFLCKL